MSGMPWQRFEVSEAMKATLAAQVEKKKEIFSFASDPLLASLVSCLGLRHELGKSHLDRASIFLGVDLKEEIGNPWRTEVIAHQGMLGLRAWIPGREELLPRHDDLGHILHPFSLSSDGRLRQLVIFPALVAERYAKRGIELVVVKEWALTAFLRKENQLDYQRTNKYEIEGRIALTQMELMEKRRLAFTGTHDLGDHLLGADPAGLAKSDEAIRALRATFEKDFSTANPSKRSLVLGYLAAVMLDDLAQPQWYGSAEHQYILTGITVLLKRALSAPDLPELFLPSSFHEIVAGVRGRSQTRAENEKRFQRFARDISLPA